MLKISFAEQQATQAQHKRGLGSISRGEKLGGEKNQTMKRQSNERKEKSKPRQNRGKS